MPTATSKRSGFRLRQSSTDVISGEKYVLRSGSLSDAMRATMAFPLAFTGLDIDGRLLMDGGMVDPVAGRGSEGIV